MSTGDRTWICDDESGCSFSISGGEDYISTVAIQHVQDVHGREISRDDVLAVAGEPEA